MMQKSSVVQLNDLKFEPLISEDQLKTRIKELAQQINHDYQHSTQLVLLGVLNGAAFFLTDLARQVTIPCVVDFMRVSSYHGTQSTGKVTYDTKPKQSIKGCDVLVVEDLLDTGLSLLEIMRLLKEDEPASLKSCVCLEKVGCNKHQVEADYVGFKTGKEFLVGYGLDYNNLGRNLKCVYKLKSE